MFANLGDQATPKKPEDAPVHPAVNEAFAAHEARPGEISIAAFCSMHSLQEGLEKVLNAVSAAVPQPSPWRLLASSLPNDIGALVIPTVPPQNAANLFAELPRQWLSLNVCSGR